MEHLSEEFWSQRYEDNITGWDLGEVSPPLKAYIDQLENKEIKILIPGCGNGYEAEYLWRQGFKDVHVLDISKYPLKNLKERCTDFPEAHLHHGDFFEHSGQYDLILEQTMFCAIDPKLRQNYANQVFDLLKLGGKLVGVLFGRDFEGGPPYGGCEAEYNAYFSNFSRIAMEPCYNSIEPRQGSELFIRITK
jgi:thiopurine S-methyltransferase